MLEFEEINFAQIIFKSQIFRLRLKGIENPIDIKFKKRKNGYSAIVCELYRALKQRKNKYTEEIERQLKEELAVGLEKENKAKNIGDQLSKFLKQVGGKTMRDLLFDATSSSLKYKKITISLGSPLQTAGIKTAVFLFINQAVDQVRMFVF